MNLDTMEGLDDAALLDDPALAEILKPLRRSRPLSFAEVRKLVETLRMGLERHANIETCGGGRRGCWRLRFSLRDGKGGVKRKSITIEDTLIAGWTLEYLERARKDRPAFRAELRVREQRKRLAANPFRRHASRLSPCGGENGHVVAAPAEVSGG